MPHSLLDLFSRLVVHIGVAPVDQAHRKVVQLVKVVAGIGDLAAAGTKSGEKSGKEARQTKKILSG